MAKPKIENNVRMLKGIMKIKAVEIFLMVQRMNELGYGGVHKYIKYIGVSYSHAIKLLRLFEKNGLVELEKEGVRNKVFYTPKGRLVRDSLLDLKCGVLEQKDIKKCDKIIIGG
jgi:hypothetical protein